MSAVTIKNMSDLEVMRLISEKDKIRQRERWEKAQRKQGLDGAQVDHKFWDTQPVPKQSEEVEEIGPINENIDVSLVKPDPFNMPAGFEWCSLDIKSPVQLQEVYQLLTENYVEDDDCNFRFDYSPAFLEWALSPPGYFPELHVGVRATKSGALMGCITAVPADIRIYGNLKHMVEVNFLCVHKKLRAKRLAPVLIKEVTRRVNLLGRWQATYTAGVYLPKPIGKCRYHHRSLNPKKLIEIKFSSLPSRTTLAKHLKDLKLPDKPHHNFQLLQREDVPAVLQLLNEALERYEMNYCMFNSCSDCKRFGTLVCLVYKTLILICSRRVPSQNKNTID
jgi:glycylpeptide N-tetradecanoyltransferase